MGDVQQNITDTTCPNCDATNVRVMKCQSTGCSSRFCEICHPNCRIKGTLQQRFDSGVGLGPFCFDCLNPKIEAAMNAFSSMVEKKRIRDNARIAEQDDRDKTLEGINILLMVISFPLVFGGAIYVLSSGFLISGIEGFIAVISILIGMVLAVLGLAVQANTSQGLYKE